jgi:YcaO-like protein with predicted kinase domain
MRAVGITRVANVTGLDHIGVPTWMVVRPLAKSLTVSQGKGLTHPLAQASGLMESIEVYHAENFTPRGHWRSLSDAAADASYANPVLLPIRPDASLDADSGTEWIPGTDLLAGVTRWVPRDCLDLDSLWASERPRLFVASSNGLASGNTLAEALLHAICELIERDQVSFWLARQHFGAPSPSTRLRLDSVSDEHCNWLIDKCEVAGVRLAVWYVTQVVPAPCFMCTVFDGTGQTFYPQRASGFGCHPYRRIALSRAIAEALQSRLTHIAGGRDDVFWSRYRDVIRIDNRAGTDWSQDLEREPERIHYDAIPEAPELPAIDGLLEWVLDTLAAAGFSQAVFVDLTQDRFRIPVVHVTVPGLEGPLGKPGYTPGPRMQDFLRGIPL